MIERRKQELELVRRDYGEISVGDNLEWVLIRRYKLPPGWSKPETDILILIPSGYPMTPPDNFYADNDLRLANNGQPGNTSPNSAQGDRQWLQFSYHVETSDWKPHADLLMGHNLLTFLHGVKRRLQEAN